MFTQEKGTCRLIAEKECGSPRRQGFPQTKPEAWVPDPAVGMPGQAGLGSLGKWGRSDAGTRDRHDNGSRERSPREGASGLTWHEGGRGSEEGQWSAPCAVQPRGRESPSVLLASRRRRRCSRHNHRLCPALRGLGSSLLSHALTPASPFLPVFRGVTSAVAFVYSGCPVQGTWKTGWTQGRKCPCTFLLYLRLYVLPATLER